MPAVDVRVNKIFINFTPDEKLTEISKCVFALAFIICLTFIYVHQHHKKGAKSYTGDIACRYLAVNIVFEM